MTDPATRYTLDFCIGALPPGTRRILEIGCGQGALAKALQDEGFEVVAIDSRADCVAAARARGVEAQVATWPAFEARDFDAVLFARALHHVADLKTSVDAAVAALRPGGRLLVEDFRAEGATPRDRRWFRATLELLRAVDALPTPSKFVADVLAGRDDDDEDHAMHGSAAMAAAVAPHDPEARQSPAAYYFRYLLGEEPGAHRTAEALLNHEVALIAAGAVDGLGLRIVATRGEAV